MSNQVSLYTLALNEGKDAKAIVSFLSHVDWSDEKAVEQHQTEYYLGRVSGTLSIKRDAAAIVLGKMGPYAGKDVDPTPDKRRTESENKAVATARVRFSQLAGEAGRPRDESKKRASRAPIVPKDVAEFDVAPLMAIIKPKTMDDVQSFALRMRDTFEKYIAMSEGFKLGDFGGAMRAYCVDVNKASEIKVKADRAEQKAA